MDSKLLRAVLAASNNQIVGRIRLQKIFYLLDQLGMGSGCEFKYHHYGPYSEDLAQRLTIESAFSNSISEVSKTTSFGTRFSTYELESSEVFEQVGDLSFKDAESIIGKLNRPSSVVIELAATIHWLVKTEGFENWRSELVERKSEKATEENTDKAVNLLKELKLI